MNIGTWVSKTRTKIQMFCAESKKLYSKGYWGSKIPTLLNMRIISNLNAINIYIYLLFQIQDP